MNVLPESFAHALPNAGLDASATMLAVEAARRGKLATEVRIGVGPTNGQIPVRVLGYAMRTADALRVVEKIIRRPLDRVVIFSSGPKVGQFDAAINLRATTALAGALRLAGVERPVTLDCAVPSPEVPEELQIFLPRDLKAWIQLAATRHGGPTTYAVEHAGASMFGDLTAEPCPPLRVTIGGRTEGRFWAVRKLVRAAALSRSLKLAPAFGLIGRAIRVPWYYPTDQEPILDEFAIDPTGAIEKLNAAANPKVGGNSGMQAEARAVSGIARLVEVRQLAAALGDITTMVRYASDMRFDFGANLGRVLL